MEGMRVDEALLAIVEEREPWLRGLAPELVRRRDAGRWSAAEILGHLIDSASNNHQRFVRAQLAESLASPGYDQLAWNSVQAYHAASWDVLVTLWASYNRHLAHVLGRMAPASLAHRVTVGDAAPVTLGELALDYVRHLEQHLRQLDGVLRGA